jgi:REP element-mobilizing transposase RayT
MLDEYGFEIYEENQFPLAYLITFRTFGTWLHGDDRGSIQRRGNEPMRTVYIDLNIPLKEKMVEASRRGPVILNRTERQIVAKAITEVCRYRSYDLKALNVRTNHTHVVAAKPIPPKKMISEFKAYATRRLRESGEASEDQKVWSRGASTRYLWKPRHVNAAIEYVLYAQEDLPFEIPT